MAGTSTIAGVKITHDGAVAVIRDGVLDFVVELEKVECNARHSCLRHLDQIADLLALSKTAPEEIDTWVVDGWFTQIPQQRNPRPENGHRTATLIVRTLSGSQLLPVAAYHEIDGQNPLDGLVPASPLPGLSESYRSHHHTIGHLASGYCTSPFARQGQIAVVVVWDGGVGPRLYVVDPTRLRVTALGGILPLKGSTYAAVVSRFPPFQLSKNSATGSEWGRHELAVPGRAMAYAGLGKASDELHAHIINAYRRLARSTPFAELPHALADAVEEAARWIGVPSADAICTWQVFVARMLENALADSLSRAGLTSAPVALVGGCALNINWNSHIRNSGRFGEVWVPPFPNDSGSALGAACAEMMRQREKWHLEWDVYRGPVLQDDPIPPGWTARPADLHVLAKLLHSGESVVVMQGRAELGPRALGHRSILAAATDPRMRDHLNKIKGRESYRPVAPICLEERAAELFEPGGPDPFMLFQHRVRDPWRNLIPAVVHADGTARLQTINCDQEPVLYELLRRYELLSGVPVLCNTSANYPGRGFFPSIAEALRWGRVRHAWCQGVLYSTRIGNANP